MTTNLTVGELLVEGARHLDTDGALLDAEVLLAHTLACSRAWLKAHPEAVPAPDLAARYAATVGRRAQGEPIAYILGYRDFWAQRLSVNPAVLVPRPETELLVERALVLVSAPAARVVDLGTGSGAIALALASERRTWTIAATDISPAALDTARGNAVALGLTGIEFVHGNWLEPFQGRRFDLIVSNPPYVAQGDPALRDASLQHEPQTALTPGIDATAALRAIIESAPACLQTQGWLVLEHGADQAARVANELVVRGFAHVRSHRDLAGHERVTEAQWNHIAGERSHPGARRQEEP